jgi:glycosyltransferase involved in cell wall biosynthesis
VRICFIGKYPPIEGGVSTSSYWLAYGLAQRGHTFHVVTNADEVEDAYRMRLVPGDSWWYEPAFPDTGGQVQVHRPEAFSARRMGHIPDANPVVSKLASLATDVIRHHRCDVVLTYYYEPYAVAGWLAAQWTRRPLVCRHAGSDLERLFAVPHLATTYREILRSADGVCTDPVLAPRFIGMGVAPERLVMEIRESVPDPVFRPDGPSLEISGPDPAVPRIGVYGKVGEFKGTFDLIAALGRLAGEELDFVLLAMIGAVQGRRIRPALEEAGIAGRTVILPFMPQWRVPDFIRACTCVCFLERDFPIAIHGPVIAREVMSCGRCLILSGEIARKHPQADALSHGVNVVLVEDPKDHWALAQALRSVVVDPAHANDVGRRGWELSAGFQDVDGYAGEWERTLQAFAGGYKPPTAWAPSAEDLIAPALRAAAARRWPAALERLRRALDANPLEGACRFCDECAAELGPGSGEDDIEPMLDALRYQRARLEISQGDQLETDLALTADVLLGATPTANAISHLRPVRNGGVRMEHLDWDVTPMFSGSDEVTVVPAHEPSVILFHRAANGRVQEFRINAATEELLSRCDGARTTAEISTELCDRYNARGAEQCEGVLAGVTAALSHLYRSGVVTFTDRVLEKAPAEQDPSRAAMS